VTLEKDRVITGTFDGSVLILNSRTGEESNRFKAGGPIVSSPIPAGGRVVIGARDYMLYGLDAKSGEIAWRNSYWFSWVESTPRLANGILYIGGSDYRRVSALDPATGHVKWATDVRGLSWSTPLVTSDTIFAATCGQNIAGTVIKHIGGIVALERRTGAVRWHYRAPIKADADFNGFVGSLVLVDGKVIGARVDGILVALPTP
jgi:outer membrane protein assembly factor BamB